MNESNLNNNDLTKSIIINDYRKKKNINVPECILQIREKIFNKKDDEFIELNTFIDYFKFYDYIYQLKCRNV